MSRRPQVQVHRVAAVEPDGDGDWTVWLANGARLTVCPEDLGRAPRVGELVRVQLPIVLGPDRAETLTPCPTCGTGFRARDVPERMREALDGHA